MSSMVQGGSVHHLTPHGVPKLILPPEPTRAAPPRTASLRQQLPGCLGADGPSCVGIPGCWPSPPLLFLRLGYIIAWQGIYRALLLVAICSFVTYLTAISFLSLAANSIAQGQSPYHLVSRAAGAELGGAVGISFYLATVFSGSLYVLAAAETILTGLMPREPPRSPPEHPPIAPHDHPLNHPPNHPRSDALRLALWRR